MPEIMDSFPEKPPSVKRVSKYDWDTWFDGRIRRFIYGSDFDILPKSFRQMLLQNARKRGVFIKTTTDGDDVIMQAFPEMDTDLIDDRPIDGHWRDIIED